MVQSSDNRLSTIGFHCLDNWHNVIQDNGRHYPFWQEGVKTLNNGVFRDCNNNNKNLPDSPVKKDNIKLSDAIFLWVYG